MIDSRIIEETRKGEDSLFVNDANILAKNVDAMLDQLDKEKCPNKS